MAYFFTPYPVVLYDPNGVNQPHLAIDITRRFRIEQITRNSKLIFYDYEIKDSDRPDIMADKYYGDPRLDWLFFLTNNIYDPYYQWPLNYKQLTDYVRQKYGSVSVAQATTHHYEQILQARTERVEYDGTIINIPERAVIVDYTTYASLATTARRLVNSNEFEENENNRRRIIKILDRAFVPSILSEFREIFRA